MIEKGDQTLKEKLLEKSPTGINGLDDVTYGGLPKGRPTLVCGSAGSGKTLMAMEFLVKGAKKYEEPGVFMAFEETSEELSKNFASLGFDLDELVEKNKLVLDYVHIDKSEIEETGEYDLEGLFIRLGLAIDSIGAKRVSLDTLEVLFSGFQNEAILRSELRRLFRWLKDKGVTAIVTGERGETSLTKYGLEEYVADCVILLDNRMIEQIATRRLRIIKYRGSLHGTNEYPFLIETDGISVLPITSLGLEHEASAERKSTGIERLDTMLGDKGYYRGATILISGTAGTGKTSFVAEFARAACERGDRCLYFAFEESPSQIIRNMRSIGIDLQPYIDTDLMQIKASRPMAYGLEMHLIAMQKLVERFEPDIVIIDPITNLTNVGTANDVKFMLTRLIDYLKLKNITAACTSLVDHESLEGMSSQGISSLMDTWINLRFFENGSERNRGISIIKSRGMEHSNQIREYLLTGNGVEIQDMYLGPSGGLLMGSSRAAQEAKETAAAVAQSQEIERKKRELENELKSLDAQIAVLSSEFEMQKEELNKLTSEDALRIEALAKDRREMGRIRRVNTTRRAVETLTRDVELPGDSANETQHDEDIYELKLYVVCNNRKSQLAFENLKEICYKYLAGKCHIQVIDLTKNPSLAREDQIVAIPTLMRKNYPGRRIIGDLSNPERVLELLELRASILMGTVNERISIEKEENSTKESKASVVKSKRSKDDLQPYIGSDFKRLSQNLDKWIFSLSHRAH